MVEPITIPDATREPKAYVEALLATLGDRDPVEVYENTPDEVRRLCRGLIDSHWFVRPDPDEWNVQQIIGHFLDVDIVYGFRWRLALTEEEPSYPGYNEKAWSQLARPRPQALLDSFVTLREANLALIRCLGPDDWTRRAVHGEQGPEDVRRMMEKIAGHDIAHINQLERTVEVVPTYG